ncbi:uncharacterized protein DS421_13g406100 [Arachis hypogaea]|nr:uncharacterized protein DS421_13g406100 [Arachis hypogaea]
MRHLSHFTCQKHPIQLAHGHIEVARCNIRYTGKRDSSFRIISGEWVEFAHLCNFKPERVGVLRLSAVNW